jgi:hypothetical protein
VRAGAPVKSLILRKIVFRAWVMTDQVRKRRARRMDDPNRPAYRANTVTTRQD